MNHSVIMGDKLSQIVYGGSGSPDEHRTMSDKVQTMASAIYRELETMIKDHGEEGVKVGVKRSANIQRSDVVVCLALVVVCKFLLSLFSDTHAASSQRT